MSATNANTFAKGTTCHHIINNTTVRIANLLTTENNEVLVQDLTKDSVYICNESHLVKKI